MLAFWAMRRLFVEIIKACAAFGAVALHAKFWFRHLKVPSVKEIHVKADLLPRQGPGVKRIAPVYCGSLERAIANDGDESETRTVHDSARLRAPQRPAGRDGGGARR
ncbi:MAG: hypothetical protein DHS20C04_23680 [Hyphococcus sp.]|nr:MAG: hypothetical protein DHS20C04_23680 [Marinicaulis sp.]